MHNRIFGWSYPIGCSGTPDFDDYPCDVCGEMEDNCICPECPVCGLFGDLDCYIDHGMVRTEEQKFSLACLDQFLDMQSFREQENLKDYWEEEKRMEPIMKDFWAYLNKLV